MKKAWESVRFTSAYVQVELWETWPRPFCLDGVPFPQFLSLQSLGMKKRQGYVPVGCPQLCKKLKQIQNNNVDKSS